MATSTTLPVPVPPGAAYAKPGPYVTQLQPVDEQQFLQWVKANKIPFDPSPTSDYDMRGWWGKNRGNLQNTQLKADGPHFSDEFKTPYHKTFSNESRYATPDAPHWDGNRLIDKSGQVLADESSLQQAPPTYRARPAPNPAPPAARRGRANYKQP